MEVDMVEQSFISSRSSSCFRSPSKQLTTVHAQDRVGEESQNVKKKVKVFNTSDFPC